MTVPTAPRYWSAPEEGPYEGVSWSFVGREAAIATATSFLVGGGTLLALHAGVFGRGGSTAGIIPVFVMLATFFVTFASMRISLPNLHSARLFHGLLAHGAHVVVGVATALALLVYAMSVRNDFTSTWLGALTFAAFLAPVGSGLGALMANAVIPERGPVPEGTQTNNRDPEHSL